MYCIAVVSKNIELINYLIQENKIIIITKDNVHKYKNKKIDILIVENKLIKNKDLELLCNNSKYIILQDNVNLNIRLQSKTNVITLGFNHKSTVTVSSVTEDYILVCIQRTIKTIENKYAQADMVGKEHITKVLIEGQISFETLVGDDFLEELEDRFQEDVKSAGNTSKKSNRLHNKVNAKNNQKTKEKTGTKDKKLKRSSDKNPKRLEDYDEAMQKQIQYELYLQEKKRKRMVVICSLVAFLCIGYVFFYYYL